MSLLPVPDGAWQPGLPVTWGPTPGGGPGVAGLCHAERLVGVSAGCCWRMGCEELVAWGWLQAVLWGSTGGAGVTQGGRLGLISALGRLRGRSRAGSGGSRRVGSLGPSTEAVGRSGAAAAVVTATVTAALAWLPSGRPHRGCWAPRFPVGFGSSCVAGGDAGGSRGAAPGPLRRSLAAVPPRGLPCCAVRLATTGF